MVSHLFEPRWYLRNAHVQTLLSGFSLLEAVDESLPVPMSIPLSQGKGKLLAMAHLQKTAAFAVLLVHGVGGHHNSTYVRRATRAFYAKGYHVIRLNLRAAMGHETDVPGLYHLGLTEDITCAVRYLSRCLDAKLYLLGFSGGGNVILKWAGEHTASSFPHVLAMATFSAPLDLSHAANHLDSPKLWPYRFHLLRGLKHGAAIFAEQTSRAKYTLEDLSSVHTLRQYDELVTVKTYGFQDAQDYWNRSSSGPYLEKIDLDTCVLHSKDDPMVPYVGLLPFLTRISPRVELKVTEKGGHVQWASGLGAQDLTFTWAIKEAMRFFEKIEKKR